MTVKPLSRLIALALLLSATAGQTQEVDELASSASQSPHVHGHSELFVVLEGDRLEIDLHSPAINLLGFEHRAKDPEQLTRIEHAKKTLADADVLFQLDSARCELTGQESDFSAVIDENAPHESGHGDDDHHEEADHVSHSHDETENHRDIEASYRYRCEQPGRLRSLTTTLPVTFPGIESLEVQWIMNGQQGAATLDKGQRQLDFL